MSKRQIPIGPDRLVCPLHKKYMSKVCHTCPLWVLIRGKDPQSEQEVDQWNCSLSWLPMLLIENAQQSRQTGAAVESFRNEVVKRQSNRPPTLEHNNYNYNSRLIQSDN